MNELKGKSGMGRTSQAQTSRKGAKVSKKEKEADSA